VWGGVCGRFKDSGGRSATLPKKVNLEAEPERKESDSIWGQGARYIEIGGRRIKADIKLGANTEYCRKYVKNFIEKN